MLTITHEAAEAIDAVVHSAPDAPDTAGLRIARGVTPDGEQGLALSVTDRPAPDDAVVEAEGTPVFLDSEAAELLDDKVLDARVQGDKVGFMIRDQGDDAAA
ncbi:MAG TPA: HesB/YadR/YfhF-family protein [Solirubrobacteraceae bacterium]|nr:HesB/YadR/YfhF-family protein [Solirubrobacteraceae bacterium]